MNFGAALSSCSLVCVTFSVDMSPTNGKLLVLVSFKSESHCYPFVVAMSFRYCDALRESAFST